jgi:hypothetical protein
MFVWKSTSLSLSFSKNQQINQKMVDKFSGQAYELLAEEDDSAEVAARASVRAKEREASLKKIRKREHKERKQEKKERKKEKKAKKEKKLHKKRKSHGSASDDSSSGSDEGRSTSRKKKSRKD